MKVTCCADRGETRLFPLKILFTGDIGAVGTCTFTDECDFSVGDGDFDFDEAEDGTMWEPVGCSDAELFDFTILGGG